MKRAKPTPTAPSENTSSQVVEKPNSPPTYDPEKDPDALWIQALVRGLRELREEREANKK
jgi:hypothetical protein